MPEDLSPYPNLKEGLLDKMDTDDLLKIDGKRYALPKSRSYAYQPGEQLDLAGKEVKVFEDVDKFHALYEGRIYGYTEPDPFPKFFSGENFNKYGNFAGEVHEKIVQIVYGDTPYDQIDEEWAKFVDSKMPQVQLVLDELNAAK